MDSYDKAFFDKLLEAWGWWVRVGKTWPNTLGYPSASMGFGDMAEPPTETARTRQKKNVPVIPDTHSSRVKSNKSKVPTHFQDDKHVRDVHRIIDRMPMILRHIIFERHVSGKSYRDIAIQLDTSHSKVATHYSEAVHYIHGAWDSKG